MVIHRTESSLIMFINLSLDLIRSNEEKNISFNKNILTIKKIRLN